MTDRTDYFLQVLETIGTPLMVSILTQVPEASAEDTAKHMAELLAKGVQTGIDLGPLIDIDKLGDKTDSARVALAGLASQIISATYTRGGKAPAEADMNRVKAGLQAVISFSDNFAAGEENVMRLAAMDSTGQGVDTPQSHVQYLSSFIPVVQVVSRFSFGQSEATLITEIATKITTKAQGIAAEMLGASDDKSLERGILQCLTRLYAACHEAETARLSGAGRSDDAPKGSMDDVWKTFDLQVQILEALVQTIVPGGNTPAPSAPAQETPVAAPPVSPVGLVAAKAEAPADAAPATEPPAAAAPPAGIPGNPMSFFGPKTDDDDESVAPTAPAAPAAPPAPETPAEPAASTPPPPAEETKPAGIPGNPMSFFTPKSEDGDEE